jgi:hypothetical protein
MSTTLLKVVNLLTGINHILCKHNAKQISKYRVLAKLKVVASGGMWVKVRGLRDRDPCTQRVVQQAANVPLQNLEEGHVNNVK